MAITPINASMYAGNSANLAFTSKAKENGTSLRQQLKLNDTGSGKQITQAPKWLKKAAAKTMFFLGSVGLLGGAAACGEDPVVKPDVPVDPTPTALTQVEEQASKTVLRTSGVGESFNKSTTDQMIDSTYYLDEGTGGHYAMQYDDAKSSVDTTVYRTTYLGADGDIQGYGHREYFIDTDGKLTSYNFISANDVFNDPEQMLMSTTKYTEDGDVISTATNGKNTYKYIPTDELDKVYKQDWNNVNVTTIVKNLFKKLR